MAIYQPTLITPDLISGAENGVVFAIAGGSVGLSWQVNGNSPLVAYQIQFFRNDAASTPGTDTGKIALAEPFYPVNSDGTQNRFSVTLPYGTAGTYFSVAALDANKQGKFIITQWWGSGNDQSVTQRSASVFRITRPTTVSVSGPTYANSRYSFDATVTLPSYAQFGESAVLWHRWQLLRENLPPEMPTLIQDTGKIWGASTYDWTADILPPGLDYYAVFSCETSNGEIIQEATAYFEAMTELINLDFSSIAAVECDRQNGAVHVNFENGVIQQAIAGTASNFVYGATGSYPATWHFTGNKARAAWSLPNVGNVTDWGFIWEGYVSEYASVLLKVTMKNGDEVTFGLQQGVYEYYDDPVFEPYVTINQPDHFKKGSAAKLDCAFTASGTTGTWDIATSYQWADHPVSTSFNNSVPVKIELFPGIMTTRLYVVFGESGVQTIQNTYVGHSAPTIPNDFGCPVVRIDETGVSKNLAYAPFGTIFDDGQIAPIVREDLTTGEYVTVSSYTDVDGGGNFLDYAALNGHSYKYYIAYQLTDTSETVMAYLGTAQPCFWSWALIEAAWGEYSGLKQYRVSNAYFFGKNFASGADGNGASPSVQPNFTPYPLVMRDVTNRHSGTLASLIGTVAAPGVYADSNVLRDAIRALSASQNSLLLRDRRGDLWEIAVAGEISCSVQDNALLQPVTASVPWVEIGPVKGPVNGQGVVTA